MTPLDGRIDCDMTGKLKGVEDYLYDFRYVGYPYYY